jgi:simple sugar transport system ATP-binding protein
MSESDHMSSTTAQPLAIELNGISKSFGAVQANKDINLKIKSGTIHGIIGENGAGKSTLMSILYGFYQADSGEININGNKEIINDTDKAIALGIGMVHQHFMLVETFSVLENVMLGCEEGMVLNKGISKVRESLKALEEEYQMRVDPDSTIEELPVGLQQRVEILKALYKGADILILDEPTGVLTPSEAEHLFKILEQLKAQGKTILLITHKLKEIMSITDEVSVMRRGTIVATRETAKTNVSELAELMVGRRVLLQVDKDEAKPSDVKMAVNNLTVIDSRNVSRVKNVSFELRAGEIVGIAGVAGNGQSTLLEAITGIQSPTSGEIIINGEAFTSFDGAAPAKLRDMKLAHVPEDRHHMGLILPYQVDDNCILGYQDQYAKGMFMDRNSIVEGAKEKIEEFDIRPADGSLKTANLSGGNQQKIVLAREIAQNPEILIIGQPTRGVDVGAIEFIHKRIIEMRDAGAAILLVSVELDEIRALSDRILVMFAGEVVGERSSDASEGELGLLMAGIEDEEKTA